jgi:hypothetical protein
MAKLKKDARVKLRATAKNKMLHLRVPEPIYKMVEELAEQNNCTASEVARAVLLEKLLEVKRIDYELTG